MDKRNGPDSVKSRSLRWWWVAGVSGQLPQRLPLVLDGLDTRQVLSN